MFDIRRVPVIRVLVPFAAGSLAGYRGMLQAGPGVMLFAGLGFACIVVLLYLLSSGGRAFLSPFFSGTALGVFFLAGVGTGITDRPVDPRIPIDHQVVIRAGVLETAVRDDGRLSLELEVKMVAAPDTTCTTLTRVKAIMHAGPHGPVPGETWDLQGQMVPVRNHGNPGEVDFAGILNRRGCFNRFYADSMDYRARVQACRGRRVSAAATRRALWEQWDGPVGSVSLLRAVCLGDRSGLDTDTREDYTRAGGMHLLAVSGLHVGLIWWILRWLLAFAVRFLGREIYRVVPVVILLWCYAWLTGFSSSVCRSVTMFTFLSVARLICHRYNPVNAILISAFILVVVHPGRLMDAGFQLSYGAVLSIVSLQPSLSTLVRVRHRFLKWFWELTCVCLAAQVGTLPLIMGYFHQVPLYSLITNLLSVPLLSAIMVLFTVTFPFRLLGWGAGLLDTLLVGLAGIMNRVMEACSSLPGAVIGGLYPDPVLVVLMMVFVLLLILLIQGRSRLPGYLLLADFCLVLLWTTWSRFETGHASGVVVGHFAGGTMVSIREGSLADHYIWCVEDDQLAWMDRYIEIAWGKRVMENSVMVIREGETGQVYRGGISACCPAGKGTWLMGNRQHVGMVVTAGWDDMVSRVAVSPYNRGTGLAGNRLTGLPGTPGGPPGQFLVLSGEPELTGSLIGLVSHFTGTVVIDGSNRRWYGSEVSGFRKQLHLTREEGAWLGIR